MVLAKAAMCQLRYSSTQLQFVLMNMAVEVKVSMVVEVKMMLKVQVKMMMVQVKMMLMVDVKLMLKVMTVMMLTMTLTVENHYYCAAWNADAVLR